MLSLGFLLACVGSAACAKDTDLLQAGQPAPDVTGENQDGSQVRLSAVRGKPAVVYFYPKDGTPGCTKEACAFRDSFKQYVDAGITIFGVSGDDQASHRKFRAEHTLPFPLVADEDGAVQKAYGVPSTFGAPARITFLVDPKGHIAKVWKDVDPGVHAEQVLKAAQTYL